MNDRLRTDDDRIGADSHSRAAEVEMARDFAALAGDSLHPLPALDESIVTTRRRQSATPRWKELLMPIASRRAWLVPAAVAALVVAGAFIPISWQRTVGHDVALTLTGVHDPARAADIAREMKSVLGDAKVSVQATEENGATSLRFASFVPTGSRIDAGARIQALASALRSRGYQAQSTSTPKREQVAGPVYALARDLVIRVETDGKTAAQIEAEIRQRLAEQGLSNTTVSVTDQGDKREVKVTTLNDQPGAEIGNVQLELTKNGAPVDASNGINVEMKRLRSSEGETLKMQVSDHGRSASVEVPHADTMSDAALQTAIESQLRSAGLDLIVEVQGGKVTVRERS